MNKSQRLLLIKLLTRSDKFADLVADAILKEESSDEIDYDQFWLDFIDETEEDEDKLKALAIALFESQRQVFLNQMDSQDNRSIRDPAMIAIWLFAFNLIWENPVKSSFLNPMLRTAVKTGKWSSKYFKIDLPDSFSVTDPNLSKQVREHVDLFATQITNTTKSQLQNSLEEGIANGENIGDLKQRVNKVFDDAVEDRSQLIATNETIWSANTGMIAAWIASGKVQKKAWVAALDEKTCVRCMNTYKKYGPHTGGIPLKENFIASDGSIANPPLHVRCRCSVAIVR